MIFNAQSRKERAGGGGGAGGGAGGRAGDLKNRIKATTSIQVTCELVVLEESDQNGPASTAEIRVCTCC